MSLEDQRAGRQAGLLERAPDVVEQPASWDLAARHVDAHRRYGACRAACAPARRVPARLAASTHAPIGTMSPVSSAIGMNVRRRDRPRASDDSSAAAPRRHQIPVAEGEDRLV